MLWEGRLTGVLPAKIVKLKSDAGILPAKI